MYEQAVYSGVKKALTEIILEILGAIAYAKGYTLVDNKELDRLVTQDEKLKFERATDDQPEL